MMFGAIAGFRLVTADPERLAAFYRAIGFDVGEAAPIPVAEMKLLGLAGAGSRIAMSLGGSRVDLESFDHPGRPYPDDATACDLVFQHLALVTDDAEAAWRRARAAGATPISRERPVTLPEVRRRGDRGQVPRSRRPSARIPPVPAGRQSRLEGHRRHGDRPQRDLGRRCRGQPTLLCAWRADARRMRRSIRAGRRTRSTASMASRSMSCR